MRSLITGIGGFAGSHLADLLISRGEEVHGTDINLPRNPLIGHLIENKKIEAHPLDIRDRKGLGDLLHRVSFDHIYHLAGITFVPDSVDAPEETLDVNLRGTLALFKAALEEASRSRILFVSSAAAYGDLEDPSRPVDERTPFRPNNPYGFTKAAGDLLAYQYGRQHGLDIVRVRPFNHTGPRQSPVFVCSEFAKAIVEIETGRRPRELPVGNLEVARDFSDVRDVVLGYALLLDKGSRGEAYNLASGRATRVGDVLKTLSELARTEVSISVDRSKLRPTEVRSIVGSAEKASRDTGWQPTIPLEQTLQDLLDWWRAHL